jgi:hypothetical protein
MGFTSSLMGFTSSLLGFTSSLLGFTSSLLGFTSSLLGFTYQVFSESKNYQGWEWFWKRVEKFSDQSALMIRDRAHTSTMLPGTDFNTVFDIIQAKVMTLDCQDVRAADEELCVYLSAIMTWLLLPANSICSLIPTLVSYDDFVRESDFDTGPRLCHARWYHAQTCVRHLVAIYTTVVQA